MKRRYRRYFVILEAQDEGFGLSMGESPKGYAKIEVKNGKGFLTLYCQNLKQLDDKTERYRIYLMNTQDHTKPVIVDVGPLETEKNGKGELTWEFNAENVKGSKTEIEEFNALIVAAESPKTKKEIKAPLAGYIDKKKTDWKPALINSLYFTDKNENLFFETKNLENIVEPVSKPLLRQDGTEEIISGSEGLEPELAEDRIAATIVFNKVSSEGFELEPAEETNEIKEQGETSREGELIEEDAAVPAKSENTYDFKTDNDMPNENELSKKAEKSISNGITLKDQLQNHIEYSLKPFPKVNPFKENLSGYEWWQIYYDYQTIYRAYMPFISFVEALSSPYFYNYSYYCPSEYHRLAYLHQHYLFGICYDEKNKAKYYVYGFPGRKSKTEQPYQGSTGFVYWHSCEGADKDSKGYWLLHIDPETGSVIKPLKST